MTNDTPQRPTSKYRSQYLANIAVALAIRNGELPHPSNFKCHSSDDQAVEYHHPSYLPDDHLCVVPLCKKCHGATRRKEPVSSQYGVVPTSIGLIRIAIATAPEQP